jgi:hypothetical protein
MTEAVSAAAAAGMAATASAIPTQITENVIHASPNDASLLQKGILDRQYPKIGT